MFQTRCSHLITVILIGAEKNEDHYRIRTRHSLTAWRYGQRRCYLRLGHRGEPGNAAQGPFGSVGYTYRISKYEVTNLQYTEFLNAVDPAGTNPNSLYSSFMGSHPRGGIAYNAGAVGGSKYSTKTNMGNKPVNYISFFDAMRFTNWLENGQPTGGVGTESGAYTVYWHGFYETRNPGATYFITSENEWYKAAYYQPADQGGDADSYWRYPTASNIPLGGVIASEVGDINNPGPNIANIDYSARWNGQYGNVTTVGSAGPLSASFYGTFDQGGNLWEWTDTMYQSGEEYIIRGGGWRDNYVSTSSGYRVPSPPGYPAPGTSLDQQLDDVGFRVASIPEPSTGLLGVLGMLGLMQRRRR